MTTPPPYVATNTRRAAAIWCHHVARDIEGINAVLEEARADPDQERCGPTHLILGLLNVFEALMPVIHTQVGVVMVREVLTDLAGLENGNAA